MCSALQLVASRNGCLVQGQQLALPTAIINCTGASNDDDDDSNGDDDDGHDKGSGKEVNGGN